MTSPIEAREPATADDDPVAAPQSAFATVPWRWHHLVIGLAPLALSRFGGSAYVPASLRGAPSGLWVVLSLLGMIWMASYPLAVLRRQGRRLALPGWRRVAREALIAVPLVPVVQVAYFLTTWGLQAGWPASTPAPDPLEEIARAPGRWQMPYLVFLGVVLAPLAEEVFNRGMIYNALRRYLPAAAATVLGALAFGMLHPFDWRGNLGIAAIGLVLILAYRWRRTLVTPMVLHAMTNALGMIGLAGSAAAYAESPVIGVRAEPAAGGGVVTEVVPGLPAAAAGLRVGDLIVGLDGEPIPPAAAGGLPAAVRAKEVGRAIRVEFRRAGESRTIEVVPRRRGP